MNGRFFILWLLTLLAHTLPAEILLQYGTIQPPLSDPQELSAAAKVEPDRDANAWIILFRAPLSTAVQQMVTDLGAQIESYIPHNALLVLCEAKTIDQINRLPQVEWSTPYRPAYKMSPALADLPPDLCPVTITLFRPAHLFEVEAWLRQRNVEITSRGADSHRATLQALVPRSLLPQLAEQPHVEWIEPHLQVELMNDQAMKQPSLNVETVWNVGGLSGKGQVIAVGDSGLDTGSLATLHPDFTNRLRHAYSFVYGTNDWSDHNGHGTHVAGSILGDGSAYSNGLYRGAAYEAELVMLAMGSSAGGSSIHLPNPLSSLFKRAYTNEARIHSNSWGSNAGGQYTAEARSIDQFIWDHDDMLILLSAGNGGTDANRDGVVDLGSIGSPASAKNGLSVGAAESGRPAGSGGLSSRKWGQNWPGSFPVSPIATDLISASHDGTHRGMAAFSARGPCADGRIKPDVVAPGTDIISCRSRSPKAGTLWGTGTGPLQGEAANLYLFSGGTSMATPLVSGIAALTRQYFSEEHGVENPSAALVKAALISGCQSLYPGQYGTTNVLEIPANKPNPVEGWGMVNAADSLYPATRTNWFWDRNRLSTGESHTFELVARDTAPLTATLVWSDYPAALAAAQQLVNDLDLLLISPSGLTNRPADRLNNIEQIHISAPESGTYQLLVHGHQVPKGPQPYALFCQFSGAPDQPLRLISSWHTPTEVLPSTNPITLNASLCSGDAQLAAVFAAYRPQGTDKWAYSSMTQRDKQGVNDLYSTEITLTEPGIIVEYVVQAITYDFQIISGPTNTFRLHSPTVYVAHNASQTWPYNQWDSAFTNLQEALDTVPEKTTIVISNGTYLVENLLLDRDLHLTSLNGPDSVLLNGNQTHTVLSMTDGLLSGVTLTNGYAMLGGGLTLAGGTVSNCIIRGNVSSDLGGGIYLLEGTIDRCRIEQNQAAQYGGGVLLRGGLINRTLILNNHAESDAGGVEVWGGTLRNCTIVGNHSDNYGGGIDIGAIALIENCIVVSNSARSGGPNWYEWVPMRMRYSTTHPQPPGLGNSSLDPQLTPDYHLRSTTGRWTPLGWTNDLVNSPCIDMGNPASDQSLEPDGNRINQGAFGNTEQASKSVPNAFKVLIHSAPNGVNPPPGLHYFPTNSQPTFSIIDTPITQGATQFLFNGWSAETLNTTTNGTGQHVQLSLTNHWIIHWDWTTQYYLSRTASGPGTISGSTNGWHTSGSPIHLTGQPNPYYRFSNWSGTLDSPDAEIAFAMNQPHNLTAHFSPLTTSNGTPHWWLAQFGLTNNMEQAANSDIDQDGHTSAEEYIANTNPTNPASILRLQIEIEADTTTLSWEAQPDRTYSLYASPNLLTPTPRRLFTFHTQSAGTINIYESNTNAPANFYQLNVER
jgi:hypothetical protein